MEGQQSEENIVLHGRNESKEYILKKDPMHRKKVL